MDNSFDMAINLDEFDSRQNGQTFVVKDKQRTQIVDVNNLTSKVCDVAYLSQANELKQDVAADINDNNSNNCRVFSGEKFVNVEVGHEIFMQPKVELVEMLKTGKKVRESWRNKYDIRVVQDNGSGDAEKLVSDAYPSNKVVDWLLDDRNLFENGGEDNVEKEHKNSHNEIFIKETSHHDGLGKVNYKAEGSFEIAEKSLSLKKAGNRNQIACPMKAKVSTKPKRVSRESIQQLLNYTLPRPEIEERDLQLREIFICRQINKDVNDKL